MTYFTNPLRPAVNSFCVHSQKTILSLTDYFVPISDNIRQYTAHSVSNLRQLRCLQEMTPSADIVKSHYTKSIIRSSAALSYPEAQARMDDP